MLVVSWLPDTGERVTVRLDHGAVQLENDAAEAGVTPGTDLGVRAGRGQGRAGSAMSGRTLAHLSERVDVDRGSDLDMPDDRNTAEILDELWHRDDSWTWTE